MENMPRRRVMFEAEGQQVCTIRVHCVPSRGELSFGSFSLVFLCSYLDTGGHGRYEELFENGFVVVSKVNIS